MDLMTFVGCSTSFIQLIRDYICRTVSTQNVQVGFLRLSRDKLKLSDACAPRSAFTSSAASFSVTNWMSELHHAPGGLKRGLDSEGCMHHSFGALITRDK